MTRTIRTQPVLALWRRCRRPAIVPGLVVGLMLCLSGPHLAAQAAPPPGPPVAEPQPPIAPQPTDPPKVDPNAPLTLNFRDASLESILDYLSEAAGFVVVKDVAVEGRISVVSRQPISGKEAVELLNTVLKEKGYVAVRMGRILKIVPLADAKKFAIPVHTGADPEQIPETDRMVTQVIPLRSIDAVKVKADIASLVAPYADLTSNAASNALILTDTQANVRRLVEIINALDRHQSTVTDVKVFPLKYANATTTARLINEVFKQDAPATQAGQNPFAAIRRFRGPGGEQPSAAEASGLKADKIVASADDRTNTVVVSGPTDVLKVVEGVVVKLDENPTADQAVFTYFLNNAKARNMETVLNSLFAETGSTGSLVGGTAARTTAQTTGRQSFFQRMTGQAPSANTQTAAAELAGQVRVVADENSNSLMVMTSSKNFERVKDIIGELDRPVRQVLIKVLVAEVTHSDSLDLGAEFSVLNLRASGMGQSLFTDFSVAAQTGGGIVRLVEKDITATLRALEVVGKLDVLSRPYILASDNQAANITVGNRVPFIRNTRITDTGQTINTIEYEDIGIILNVTPHVNPDGVVTLDVEPEISALTGETVPISSNVDAPVFAKRSAKSRVAIRDGQTIVIGGLMEDRKTDTIRKVPLLGDIPLLGGLFRRTIKEKSKTELLIFLTPHVAHEPGHLKGMSEDEMKGVEVVPDAVEKGTFDSHMEGMKRGAVEAPDNAAPSRK